MQAFLRLTDRLAALVRATTVGLAVAMLVALALQVLMRYVFGKALSWTEELALGCFTWTMLLAISLGVRDAIHVRMDLLVDRLPDRARRVAERAILLAIAVFGAFLAWSGGRYLLDTQGMTSAAIGYPIGYLYAAAPAAGALIALFCAERLLRSFGQSDAR